MVESSGTLRDADLRGSGPATYAQVSRLAVLSLILGVLGCALATIPVALACGIVAVKRIRASKGAQVGMPVAVLGIVLSILMAGAWAAWYLWRENERARGIERSTQVVADFFEYAWSRDFPSAFELFSDQGKQEIRGVREKGVDPLERTHALLKQTGRVQRVDLVQTFWKAGRARNDVAEIRFNIVTEKQTIAVIVTLGKHGDKWLMEGLPKSGEAPPPPSDRPTVD